MRSRALISVVVPCLNEEDNVAALASAIEAASVHAGINTEIVFVDDGSNDATPARISAVRSELPIPVRVGTHESTLGIPAAWRTGISIAGGNWVCLIDADLQHDPADIFRMYRRLEDNPADFAQGVRAKLGRPADLRLRVSRVLNRLLNLAFRMHARDSKSGFLLGPKNVIADIIEHKGSYRYFQTFVSASARSRGYQVLEVPTVFRERERGSSFIAGRTLSTSLLALADFPTAIREFRRKHHPLRSSPSPRVGPRGEGAVRRHPYSGWRRVWFEAFFLTMPLHKWMIRRTSRKLYLELKQTEGFTRSELDTLQLWKLQRVVQHAYVHVPYYRRRLKGAGMTSGDIVTLLDVSKLPLLSKDDVRENLHFDLFSDVFSEKDTLRVTTSGSTGMPFTTYADRYQLEMRFASTLRALEWTGWRFGDRQARLWHQTLGMSRSQVIREKIDAWFMRRLFIPAFEISPTNLEAFINRIRKHNPVLVDGYAESLNFLATYVREGNRPGFAPRSIMSSAQALPDSVRRSIEAGFSTRVFDKYGSREFSGIAYQCEASDNHHVMDESYIVELLVDGRPARPGEIGEVVITDLNNYTVPLIRYRIGDLAVAVEQLNPCPCGRSLSQIGRIEGRTQAIVHCGDGTWLPGTFFAHFFKDHETLVRFFQIHQEAKGRFTLQIVKNDGFTETAFRQLLSALREYTGSSTEVVVEFVESIPLVRTGKRSPVVSTVIEDFQSLARATSDGQTES